MESADLINSIIIICVMLLLSAFFSGMEIAFLSKNRLREEIDRKQSPLFDFIEPWVRFVMRATQPKHIYKWR